MQDQSTNGPAQRSWLDRISQALLGEPQDREQLVELLRSAQQRELLDVDALAMIEGVFEVSEMRVRDIMIPRSQMKVVDYDAAIQQVLPLIIESAHSRFPVINESKDKVEGILLAKDLLRYFVADNDDEFNIDDILRPASYIPESKRLNVLLNEFRERRNHMALVVDEYGGIAGLVTIEDVLEQIVGDIVDEHDPDTDAYIFSHEDDHFTIKALTPIEDFNEYFGATYSDEDFDTIAGLVVSRLGHVPKRGEILEIDRFSFEVLRADKRRVRLLQMTIKNEDAVAVE